MSTKYDNGFFFWPHLVFARGWGPWDFSSKCNVVPRVIERGSPSTGIQIFKKEQTITKCTIK